jgi:pyrrolysine biosynthesis protein PylC
VIYEHIHVIDDHLEVVGEHIMTDVGPLHLYPDFFGADEALSSYSPGKTEWVATLIITGKDCQAAWYKRCIVLQEIQKEFGLIYYSDLYPV